MHVCVHACVWLTAQDAQLNDMRTMIKVLQEDCKSLASALTQICNTGADVGSVLQTLPPNLVQVGVVGGWVQAGAGAPWTLDSIACRPVDGTPCGVFCFRKFRSACPRVG